MTRQSGGCDRPPKTHDARATDRVAQAFRCAIAAALEPLDAPGRPSQAGVHEVRRSLKRARAALRLMRFAFDAESFADEDALLRGCARSVSAVRDADVLLATLSGLRKRFARERSTDELAPLERFIRMQREAVTPKQAELARAARLLRGSDERLRLRMRRPMNASSVEKALRGLYRRGRKAYARACLASTAESMHRWRKHAKYFANAIDALGDAATGRQSKRATLSRQIADWLGEHHDLATLDRVTRESGDVVSPPARRTLCGLIEKRQRKLERRALRAARRLYAAKARRVAALGEQADRRPSHARHIGR